MLSVVWPCKTTRVSDSFWDHKNRTPPSTNPGTDIACSYGEVVWAVGDGVVTSVVNDTNSAAGRYITIALDGGGYVEQKLHLSKILVVRGQRVSQYTPVALSGASGFGSEYGYGSHLHQTFRVNGANEDFERYASIASAAGSAGTPFEEDDMPLTEEERILLRRSDENVQLLVRYLLLPRNEYPSTVDQTLETYALGKRNEQDRNEVRDNVRWIVYNLMAGDNAQEALIGRIAAAVESKLGTTPGTIDIGELSKVVVQEISARLEEPEELVLVPVPEIDPKADPGPLQLNS